MKCNAQDVDMFVTICLIHIYCAQAQIFQEDILNAVKPWNDAQKVLVHIIEERHRSEINSKP